MKRVIVITGASSGIGAALAELLGQKGARLTLAARRELSQVTERAGVEVQAITAEVTRRSDVERIAAECLARFGRIDVWIDNTAKHALNALTANLRLELRGEPQIFVSAVHPGVVATEFGQRALHGGPDSRQLPGAQSAEEVAAVLVCVIETPRADVYTRPQAKQMVLSYYGAEDMAEAERHPPFFQS